MNVSFGICLDDPNVINKQNITLEEGLDCEIKEKSTIINPTMIVKATGSSSLHSYNYAYIAKWNRYYYITNVTFTTGGRAEVSMKIDALYTYSSYLNSTKVYMSRVGEPGLRAAYLLDSQYPITQTTYSKVISPELPVQDPMSATGYYVMTVVGGEEGTAPTP